MAVAVNSGIFSQLALNTQFELPQVARILPLFLSNTLVVSINDSFFAVQRPAYPPADVAERDFDAEQADFDLFNYLLNFLPPSYLIVEPDNLDGSTFVSFNPYYSLGYVDAGYDTLGISQSIINTLLDNWFFLTRRLTLLDSDADQTDNTESMESRESNASVSVSLFESGLQNGHAPGAATTYSGNLSLLNPENSPVALAAGSGVLPFTSNDLPINYIIENSQLIAQAGGETIFILQILPNNQFSFQLNNNLDHPLPGADQIVIDLSEFIQIGNINLPPGTFIIRINDDIPLAVSGSNQQSLLHEDALPGANIDTPNPISEISGALSALVSFGADGQAGFHFISEPALSTVLESFGLSSGGQLLDYQISDNRLQALDPDGNEVFNLIVNTDGSYQFILQQSLDHLGSNSSIIPIPLGFLIEATDGDGDGITLNNQFIIVIADDTPFVVLSTDIPESIQFSDSVLNLTLSTSLADSFIGQGGADGLSSLEYQLQLNNTVSGLTDSLTGLPIILSVNAAGEIVGYAGSNLVLVFTIDANAELSFTQFRPIVHPDNSLPNEVINFPSGIVAVVAIATDGDGDQGSSFLDIASLISIQDAGPSLSVTDPGAGALSVNEATLGVNSSIALNTVFSSNTGPDGGSVDYHFELVSNDSGLIDSLSGLPVLLSINAEGNVEGRAGGLLVFTLSVDANAIVLDLDRGVIHPAGNGTNSLLFAEDLISLVATVTDGDGDTVSESLDVGALIQVIDGVPSLTVDGDLAGTLNANENSLNTTVSTSLALAFEAAIGADGSLPIDYALQINNADSGLIDTLSQEAVILSFNGTVVEGRTQLGDELVFSVSIDSSGELSFIQLRSVVHGDGNGTNSINLDNNILSVIANLTDRDGDNSSAQLDLSSVLSIIDDVPQLSVDAGQIGSILVLETQLGVSDSVSLAAAFIADLGADAGTLGYELSISNVNSGLIDSLSGVAILLTDNNGVIEGRANGELVFTLSIDANGLLSFTQLRSIIHPDSNDPADTLVFPANVVEVVATALDGDNDQQSAAIDISAIVSIQDAGPSLLLTDPGAGALSVNEATLGVNSSIVLSAVFNSNVGPDGGSVDYQFELSSNDSGLIDSLSGLPVLLSINAQGNVEGRAGGLLVFTLSVDANAIVLDLDRGVIHPAGNGTNSLLFAEDLISLVTTVTDGDGDTVSESLDVGALIQVIDGVPSLTADGDFVGTLNANENSLNTTVSTSLALAFEAAIGADGSLPIDYALQINNADSGLIDTLSQQAVILSFNGNVVEGRTQLGDELVFSVSIDSSGELSFTQLRAVVHGDGNGTNSINLDSNILSVIANLTDRDGDSSSAQLDLTSVLFIIDDVPQLSVDAGQIGSILVLETQLGVSDSVSLAVAFIADFGADAGALAYDLSIINTNTGLIDSLSGAAVLLTDNNGVIEGRANGELVFTLSIDASGVLSFTQLRAINHPDNSNPADTLVFPANIVQVIATAIDGDNDQQSAAIDISTVVSIQDAGPSLSVTDPGAGALSVNEATLGVNSSIALNTVFSSNTGPDGGSVDYQFELSSNDSGLMDSLSGLPVLLSINAQGNVEGRAGGLLVFTLSVDANAIVLDLDRGVIHPAGNGTNSLLFAEDLISLVATVTDGDGDTVSEGLDVGALIQVIDGVPSLTVDGDLAGTASVNENSLNTTASVSLALAFEAAIGADGSLPIDYALQINNVNSGLFDTLSQEAVILSFNGTVVEGRTQLGDELVFSVSIDSSGELSFTQLRSVVHGDGNGTNSINLDSNILSVIANLTDRDGDNSSAQLDLSSVLSIIDDLPQLSVDAGQIGSILVLETQLGVSDSVSLAAAFIADLGADAGTLGYELSISNVNSGLIDSLSGAAILLTDNNGVIEGRANGELVFTLSIDANGLLSFTQLRSIIHPDSNDPADTLVFPANVVEVVATALDGDNDQQSAAIDISAIVSIQDAGPSLLLTDPGAGALSVNEATLGVNSSIVLSAVFNSNVGPDGGSVDYQFELSSNDSGLIDSLSGLPVLLSITAQGNVEGRAGGLLVFTLSVDANAIVLDLDRGVIHPAGNGTNSLLFAEDLISLVTTVTDGDGDTVSESLDVGALIQVIDGVPSLTADGDFVGTLNANENSLNTTVSTSLALAFEAAIGADGSLPIDYALQINNADSGLIDTLSQQAVILSFNGNVVEGRTQLGDELVFSVSIDSSGELSFTQLRAVVHGDGGGTNSINLDNNILSVIANLTDRDGDSSSALLDLTSVLFIIDDVPQLTVDAGLISPLTINEAQLGLTGTTSVAAAFGADLGADEGNLDYALQISGGDNTDSGLIDSLTGASILLTNNNGSIEGRANGQLVFTVSVDAAGLVSFTQYRSVIHADAAGANALNLAVNSIFVIATALDGDNDQLSAQISLGEHLQIIDAIPSLSGASLSETVHEDVLPAGNSEGGQTLSVSGSLAALASVGNDSGQWIFDANYESILSANNLTANGASLSYSLNGNILTASAAGVDIFTFELNSGGIAGNFIFNLLAAIDHPLTNGNDLEQVLVNLGSVINLIDNDNDLVNLGSQFVIAIQDDVPIVTASAENANVYESNLSLGPVAVLGSLDALVAFGGDEQGFFLFRPQAELTNLPAVTVNGEAVTYEVNGNTLSALVNGSPVFTLELEANGDYTFTLITAIDHAANEEWLALDFSTAIRAVDRDGDPVNLGAAQFVVNVADNAVFNPNAGDMMYLTTSLGGVVPMEGFYGLSALDPIEGDLPALIAALIGPGGILAGGTTEDALALILEQEGVFFNEDILKLTADGYEMAFNGSENFNFETSLLNQLSLLGFSIDGLHVVGNQILFSTATGGNLPGIGNFENQDIVLATQGSDGRYTFELFLDGSAQGLQDGLLNDGIFQNLLVDFNMDDFSFTSSDNSFNNGTLYFTLSNLVDVDLAYALQTLDVWGGITANGTEVLSINRVNGSWDIGSLDIYFRGEDIGLTDELLGNALQALNNVDLAGLVAALLDPDTRLIEIDGLEVKGDTLYFSLAPILNVDLLFGSLGELLSNPFDPLSALTFRGEDIYSVTKNPVTNQWDVNTLKLFFDGSEHGLASNDGLLGGLLDNLPENLNAFSLTEGTEVHDTILFSTEGGGNERQVGGYDNQTLIEYNNGQFHESFDLAAITNGSLNNRNITSVHILDNGSVLFTLSTASTLPGNVLAGTNDVIQWNGSNFSLYFDGSSHGLDDSQIINSLYVFPDNHANAGQMVFSLAADSSLPGVGDFANEDLILFNPVNNSYSLLFDGSTAGINDLSLDVTVTTDLSASVGVQVDLLFNPLLTELDGLVDDALGAIETNLNTLDGLLLQLQTVLNSNPIAILLNLVGDLLTGLDNLLGTGLNSLLDGLSTATGIDNLIGELTDLIDELTPTPLSLLLNQTLVNSIKSLSTTIIGQLDALDANYLSTLNNAIDTVDQGILALTSTLEDAVSAGAQLEVKILDVSVNGLHIKENGDYLLSFSQDLRADIILNLDTSFLAGLASLNLAVNTDTLITELNDILDPIVAPLLGALNLTDVLSPDLSLTGMNIYQLHQDQTSGTWQFSLYFDGVDHGLDNGGLGDTVLDYVTAIDSNLTVLDLQDLGVLHLSSNENLDAIYVNEQHGGAVINGSDIGDLLVGDAGNNTFNGGMGNDLMIGGKGADNFNFDAASLTAQSPQQDVIADFKPAEGDVLTLDQIFNNYNSSNPSSLSNYINISVINSDNIGGVNDSLLSLSADPNGAVVQTITLLNYVPAGATSVEMLQNLLNQGSLVVNA
ncbi:hypothetical protein B1207_03320 [Legionella quinlivanii]|uniref:DUF5801 domain-containing protein n=1 Tax=Legionella quinlivanii TaxID=45073 RepID=A0A364LME2_9GAMM|nr:DUF5801 repeats-in-toxin domain-containing protein [Legionella quinlivanii]RAP38032.1 hypothetical protein B1207_03320 [Legionella quinlivanii]